MGDATWVTGSPVVNNAGESLWRNASPLLLKWLERSRRNQLQHFQAASHYDRAHWLLGVPTIILSTFVGTTVFATLERQVGFKTVVAVGAISILSAVLAALQTFLRYGEKAEKHRASAAAYSGLRKQIEEIGFLPVQDRGTVKEFLEGLRRQFESLAQSAPTPPRRLSAAFRKEKGEGYFIPSWLLESASLAEHVKRPAETIPSAPLVSDTLLPDSGSPLLVSRREPYSFDPPEERPS